MLPGFTPVTSVVWFVHVTVGKLHSIRFARTPSAASFFTAGMWQRGSDRVILPVSIFHQNDMFSRCGSDTDGGKQGNGKEWNKARFHEVQKTPLQQEFHHPNSVYHPARRLGHTSHAMIG